MKKSTIIFILSAVCIISLCICFFAFRGRADQINIEDVQKIIVWKHSPDPQFRKELDTDEVEKFVELYEAANYGGKATGEGGTPEFGVLVYFLDGTHLHISDFKFMNHDLEVSLHNGEKREKAYYLNSQKLYAYMAELIEKYY